MPTIKTSNMKLLAVVIAAGIKVDLFRKPGRSQTVIGEFPDNAANRALIENYEKRHVLPVPQKSVMQSYVELGYECKRLIMGAL